MSTSNLCSGIMDAELSGDSIEIATSDIAEILKLGRKHPRPQLQMASRGPNLIGLT